MWLWCESDQKTLKVGIHSFPAWHSAFKRIRVDLTRRPKRSLRCLLVEVLWQINEYLNLSVVYNLVHKAAITHNEIIESIVVTARKTITIVIVAMSLKRFSAEWSAFAMLQRFHCVWSQLKYAIRQINKGILGLGNPLPISTTILFRKSITTLLVFYCRHKVFSLTVARISLTLTVAQLMQLQKLEIWPVCSEATL